MNDLSILIDNQKKFEGQIDLTANQLAVSIV
jgi:hypothetical protein